MNISYIVPAITVFDEKGELDEKSSARFYAGLVKAGVDGVAVLGSTGEFFALSVAQKKRLIACAGEALAGKARLLAGVGSRDWRETADLANFSCSHGVDAVMVIAPCYFPLSDESILHYYGLVAENTDAQIILYNFPDRTGYSIKPEIVVELARRHKNIVGIKDSVASMAHTREIIKAVRPAFPDFEVMSGMDDNFVHTVLSGGNGCIGALGNIVPAIVGSLAASVRGGDFAAAAIEQQSIDILNDIYGICTPFVPALKRAARMLGADICEYCSDPFLPPNEKQTEEIAALLERAGLLK